MIIIITFQQIINVTTLLYYLSSFEVGEDNYRSGVVVGTLFRDEPGHDISLINEELEFNKQSVKI